MFSNEEARGESRQKYGLDSMADKGSSQWSEVSARIMLEAQNESWELRHLFAQHLLNTSLDTKSCPQHLVGEIKYIHMKTTRTHTAYGADEQMENATVCTLYINKGVAFVEGGKGGSITFRAFKNKGTN